MPEIDKKHPVFGLHFRRYAPFAKFGRMNPYTGFTGLGYFEGDNRGPSTSLQAASRTYGAVMFNRFGIVHSFFNSSGTHFHPAIGSTVVGMSKVSHTLVRHSIHGPDMFGFKASTAGNNPLVKPSPDINTFVDVVIDFGSQTTLKVSGEAFGDSFPNLEVFLMDYRSSRTAMLLDGQTGGGAHLGPATKLYGASESRSLGRFRANLLLDSKGELRASSTVGPTAM